MDFGDIATGAEILHAVGKSRVQLRGIEKVKESALGIEAGDDGVSGDFFAASENEGRYRAVLQVDVPNLSIGADFGARGARGFSKGASKGPEPSAGERSGAHWMGISGGTKKKNRRGTCGPGTQRRAEYSTSRDGRANQFRFEEFRDKIGNSHGAPAKEVENAFLA
jgi:hypothetical protein